MRRFLGPSRLGLALVLAVTAILGCSDVQDDAPCQDGEGRCVGNQHQLCVTGRFSNNETCGGTLMCTPTAGCAECDPALGSVCVGAAVNQCLPDGTVGGQLRDCGGRGCLGGRCNSDCTVSGSDRIYVVDRAGVLHAFDPSLLGAQNPFAEIGALDCPAGSSMPGLPDAGDPATPFSMAVDRSGLAWVLYSSGEIFWVSTTDAQCVATPYSPGQAGFELFGMGFVAEDGESERLFLAGGAAGAAGPGSLGVLDPLSLELQSLAPIDIDTVSPTTPPELTGTGAGVLFGYVPGNQTAIVELSRTTATELRGWALTPQDGTVVAYAFAHWGGELFVFVTTQAGIDEVSSVIRFNPALGSATTALADSNIVVVGAGVSTCAPTEIE